MGSASPLASTMIASRAQARVGQLLQRLVQSSVVVQTADAAARDRDGLIDLAGYQSGVDIDVTEVVDDDANSRTRCPEHVVQQAGLARAEVSGQRDDGDGWHPRSVGPPSSG